MREPRPDPRSEIATGLPGRLGATRHVILKIGLVLLSLVVAAAAAEVALRVIAPKYRHAANARFDFDSFRLRSHTPSTSVLHRRPDTGRLHPTMYNNLGMRQHRNFTSSDLDSRTLIAFFGDSFTENSLIPAHTVFTDVLDFLLNVDSDQFTVMNFGVDGYGTDQSYLHYKASMIAQQPAHMFYLFCPNDLRNLYENGLLYLDENGDLKTNETSKPSMFLRAISRLYLTYFALEVRSVLRFLISGKPSRDYTAEDVLAYKARTAQGDKFHSPRADQLQAKFENREWLDVSYYIDLLLTITRQWKDLVEQQGGRFHIVLLPREEEDVAEDLLADRFSVLNLYKIFSDMRSGYEYDTIRFREDDHWNETGNMLAAIALYKQISRLLGRAPADDATIAARLRKYYSAFDGDWYPADLAPRLPASPEFEVIRNKYLALEAEMAGHLDGGTEARMGAEKIQ